MTNYLDELSDGELEAMQDEINEVSEDEMDEVIEEEAKEAVNEKHIFESIGIDTKYVLKFIESYPKKKAVYQNFITKQFLKWYINNVNLSLLKNLVQDSGFIKEAQQEEISKLINKQLNEKIDIDDLEKIVDIELEDEYTQQMYEIILHERWNKDRVKGIRKLDGLIEEQMRTENCDTSQALYNLINAFDLDGKLKDIAKKEPKLIKELAPKKPKRKEKTKDSKITKAIKYFHHIEFLYELMTEKMDFAETPTEDDIEHITKIRDLLFGHLEEEEKEKSVGESTKTTMDSFFEDD